MFLDGYLRFIADWYVVVYFFLTSLILEIIAASIFVTLAGPPESCGAKAPLAFCASTTILVPISWMAATLREHGYALPSELERPNPSLFL